MTRRVANPRAFTVTELMVVIVIFALLAAAAVPAISTTLRSINRSLADSQLRVAITGARDAAIRNAGRGDAAAVFTFDPGGRLRVYTCVYAGTLTDEDGDGNEVSREVFVPDPLADPVALPKGWSVRAYVPAYTMESSSAEQWYEETYGRTSEREQGNWVFPETGFFDVTEPDAGENRQTFMIRFRSGTGEVAYERTGAILTLLPVEAYRDSSGRLADFRDGLFADYNAIESVDLRKFVVRVLGSPDVDMDDRRDLLGDKSSDTVLVRPVTQIALYRETELAAALNARLDRTSGTVYELDRNEPLPQFVKNVEVEGINDWMIGSPEVTTQDDEEAERRTRVFTLQLVSGSLRELTQ